MKKTTCTARMLSNIETPEQVNKFLKEYDVNARDKDGWTLGHCLSRRRDSPIEMLKLWIDNGGDINARDNDGMTLGHVLAIFGGLEKLELWIVKGGDVNAKTDNGLTLGHFLALNKRSPIEMLEVAIEKGLDLHIKDNDDKTLLDFANRYNRHDMVKVIEDALMMQKLAQKKIKDWREVYLCDPLLKLIMTHDKTSKVLCLAILNCSDVTGNTEKLKKSLLSINEMLNNRQHSIDASYPFYLTASMFFSATRKFTYTGTLPTIDVCGTGGDGLNTLNISTAVSLLLAKSGKLAVAKHGGSAVSSKSGSADVFDLMGLKLPEEEVTTKLNRDNFAFLFAPYFNPFFASFAPIRKELKVRTIFNLLGPMLNPVSNLQYQVVGLPKNSQLSPKHYAMVLWHTRKRLKKLAIVSGDDGMDEISICGTSQITEYDGVDFKEYTVHPNDFGLSVHNISALQGSDPHSNLVAIQELLGGSSKNQAFKDIVLLNAAFALYVANCFSSVQDAIDYLKTFINCNPHCN